MEVQANVNNLTTDALELYFKRHFRDYMDSQGIAIEWIILRIEDDIIIAIDDQFTGCIFSVNVDIDYITLCAVEIIDFLLDNLAVHIMHFISVAIVDYAH